LATGTNFVLFGADVQAWQGQVAKLDFTVLSTKLLAGPNNNIFLDAIQFSGQAIPEPGGLWLFLGGLSFIGFWRWRKIH